MVSHGSRQAKAAVSEVRSVHLPTREIHHLIPLGRPQSAEGSSMSSRLLVPRLGQQTVANVCGSSKRVQSKLRHHLVIPRLHANALLGCHTTAAHLHMSHSGSSNTEGKPCGHRKARNISAHHESPQGGHVRESYCDSAIKIKKHTLRLALENVQASTSERVVLRQQR